MSAAESLLRQATARHGKSQFSYQEQLTILKQMLINERQKLKKDSTDYKLIEHTLTEFKNQSDQDALIQLENAKTLLKIMIAQLEQQSDGSKLLQNLKNSGLFRMLYHHSNVQGRLLPKNDILNVLLKNGFIGVGISALFIALFIATSIFTVPAWLSVLSTGLFTGGVTYLSGMLYGVVNDLFATRANLPYFLLGHQPQQLSLLKTNDPAAQGIAWGIAATFGPVAAASVVFTIAATITAAFVPLATFCLPVMMIAMPLIAVGAEIYAQQRTTEIEQTSAVNRIYFYLNPYQSNGIRQMCLTNREKAAWFANSDRNMFGFTRVPLIGLAALIGLVGLSATGLAPIALMGSTLFSTILPIGFASVIATLLSGAGIYMHVNKDTQLDDRYKLNFDNEFETIDDLYLDQDLDLAQQLINQHQASMAPSPTTSATVDSPSTTSSFSLLDKYKVQIEQVEDNSTKVSDSLTI